MPCTISEAYKDPYDQNLQSRAYYDTSTSLHSLRNPDFNTNISSGESAKIHVADENNSVYTDNSFHIKSTNLKPNHTRDNNYPFNNTDFQNGFANGDNLNLLTNNNHNQQTQNNTNNNQYVNELSQHSNRVMHLNNQNQTHSSPSISHGDCNDLIVRVMSCKHCQDKLRQILKINSPPSQYQPVENVEGFMNFNMNNSQSQSKSKYNDVLFTIIVGLAILYVVDTLFSN